MSNFTFLQTEWPEIYTSARRVEEYVQSDPRSACFHAHNHVMLSATKHPYGLTLPTPQRLQKDHAHQTPLGFFTSFRMTNGSALS